MVERDGKTASVEIAPFAAMRSRSLPPASVAIVAPGLREEPVRIAVDHAMFWIGVHLVCRDVDVESPVPACRHLRE